MHVPWHDAWWRTSIGWPMNGCGRAAFRLVDAACHSHHDCIIIYPVSGIAAAMEVQIVCIEDGIFPAALSDGRARTHTHTIAVPTVLKHCGSASYA